MAELSVPFAHISANTSFSAANSATVYISHVPFLFHWRSSARPKGKRGTVPPRTAEAPAPFPVDAVTMETEPSCPFGRASGKFASGSGRLKGTRSAQHSALRGSLSEPWPRPLWVGENAPVGKTGRFQIEEGRHVRVRAPGGPAGHGASGVPSASDTSRLQRTTKVPFARSLRPGRVARAHLTV